VSQLCALGDVKTYLGITTTAMDAVLSALITNASAFIESYCNRVFALSSYTESYNGTGGDRLYSWRAPIVSVASLSVDGIAIQAAPNTQSPGFVFDDDLIYLRGARFCKGVQNVTVSYTAGFAAIPADVNQACIELVALKYAKRDRIDKSSETLGTQQTQAYAMADMPAQVKTALNNYRRWPT
jgi:hypothetical protein